MKTEIKLTERVKVALCIMDAQARLEEMIESDSFDKEAMDVNEAIGNICCDHGRAHKYVHSQMTEDECKQLNDYISAT